MSSAVWVCDGAVATSGTYRRRWDTASDLVGHHIIDPVTGAPSRSDLSAVTVVAPTAEASEVIAKAALIGGSARALNIIGAYSGAEGLLTGNDGAWIFSPRWKMNLVGEDGGVL
ncbi:MAG: FAD:protein FMN transferase [Chloroflexi bacterium]|nr:FAD:protein FMN transferase [Chloroflexota bacterium]